MPRYHHSKDLVPHFYHFLIFVQLYKTQCWQRKSTEKTNGERNRERKGGANRCVCVLLPKLAVRGCTQFEPCPTTSVVSWNSRWFSSYGLDRETPSLWCNNGSQFILKRHRPTGKCPHSRWTNLLTSSLSYSAMDNHILRTVHEHHSTQWDSNIQLSDSILNRVQIWQLNRLNHRIAREINSVNISL